MVWKYFFRLIIYREDKKEGVTGLDAINDKMKLFKENKVVNWHEHVWPDDKGELDEKDCDLLVKSACNTYMDKLICSLPITQENPKPDDVKKCNNIVAKAMRRYPKMIKGLAFINPGYVKEALAEIGRCVNDLGMIGVK